MCFVLTSDYSNCFLSSFCVESDMKNYVRFSTQDAEQKDHEFKVSLSYIVRTCLKQKKNRMLTS